MSTHTTPLPVLFCHKHASFPWGSRTPSPALGSGATPVTPAELSTQPPGSSRHPPAPRGDGAVAPLQLCSTSCDCAASPYESRGGGRRRAPCTSSRGSCWVLPQLTAPQAGALSTCSSRIIHRVPRIPSLCWAGQGAPALGVLLQGSQHRAQPQPASPEPADCVRKISNNFLQTGSPVKLFYL